MAGANKSENGKMPTGFRRGDRTAGRRGDEWMLTSESRAPDPNLSGADRQHSTGLEIGNGTKAKQAGRLLKLRNWAHSDRAWAETDRNPVLITQYLQLKPVILILRWHVRLPQPGQVCGADRQQDGHLPPRLGAYHAPYSRRITSTGSESRMGADRAEGVWMMVDSGKSVEVTHEGINLRMEKCLLASDAGTMRCENYANSRTQQDGHPPPRPGAYYAPYSRISSTGFEIGNGTKVNQAGRWMKLLNWAHSDRAWAETDRKPVLITQYLQLNPVILILRCHVRLPQSGQVCGADRQQDGHLPPRPTAYHAPYSRISSTGFEIGNGTKANQAGRRLKLLNLAHSNRAWAQIDRKPVSITQYLQLNPVILILRWYGSSSPQRYTQYAFPSLNKCAALIENKTGHPPPRPDVFAAYQFYVVRNR
ncbi:hypothetical protein DFH09DRAFT_1091084 [Mycena vulgaris]|nr:hypothetical protein DFH09DRAFT_1091084 [Mycena vulgaris]